MDHTLENDDQSLRTVRDHFRSNVGVDEHDFSREAAEKPAPDRLENSSPTSHNTAADYNKSEPTMATEETTSTAIDEQDTITETDFSQEIPAPHAPTLEVKSAPPENSTTTPTGESAPVDADVLADLISRDIIGIAAEASDAFEAEGHTWPIEASVLRAAAGARAPHREYGHDTQRFLAIANKAISARPDALGSALLLGALIQPAIMEPTFSLRGALSDLCQGSLGQHLKPVAEAIADLDYDFPPSADELADLSGTQREPLKRRLAKQLADWCDTYSLKTSRWPFATSFMHHIVSEHGSIGAARLAIEKGSPDAIQRAKKAISDLSSPSDIEDSSIEFATFAGRTSSRLHPKGIEYLNRQFDVPLGLIDSWLRAIEREGNHRQRSAAKLRTTVGNLVTRLDNAAKVLREQGLLAKSNLERAIAIWIAQKAEASIEALEGSDTSTFPTLDEALTAERDLLPAAVREAIDFPDLRFEAIRTALADGDIPTPAAALERARKEAAFDTAARIAGRFGYEASGSIREDMIAFAEIWGAKIEARERRLKALAKVDFDHQDAISRHLNWCKFTLERLAALREGSEIHDLADIPANTAELDDILDRIETNIREGQVARILRYRNDQNSDDTETLLNMLDELTNEAIEDRIAQLRDGRSAATFQTDLEGLIRNFTPDFLTFAASESWPASIGSFREALAGDGKLAIEEDRRAAGVHFISLYRDVVTSMTLKMPAMSKARELLEEIGFENVNFHSPRALGSKTWQVMLTGTIRSDGWFLPPIFGSKAVSGYKLLIIGPDTLPETIIKALEPGTPAILLVAGVADLTKRLEFAERLRAGAYPVLFIDEALIAFAATRRDTRARTIFECGLPYGRVEPYTTDAGQIPPEMFFGRAEEIRSIMSKTADGCLVYGGRQLGKSALLSHVSRTRNAPDEDRIVLRREVKSLGNAEKTSEIWGHLNAMLMPYGIVRNASRDADSVSRDIKQWLATRPHGQIVCMFDETDHFMASDTKEDYPELSRLKELMEDTARSFKIVFAGLHNVQRMHRQPNSPLAHLGHPICIGPLNRTEDDKRAAHELVVQPTRAAGFRFESLEAVEEILAWANYYPSLVQEYAKGLLATLHGAGSGKAYKLPSDGPLWTIPSQSLFDHRGFNAIEVRVRQKFHWTLDLDPRYALITYTLARLNAEGNEHQSLVSGFKPVELREEAMAFWPKSAEQPSQASFDALLDELFDLGVLGRVPVPNTNRFTYLLRTRQVAAMLGSIDDIYHALAEIEEKDPTVAYDRAIYRRRYAPPKSTQRQSEWPYSPLTDLQIERIVAEDSFPVQIVCGLEVLGLSKIGRALKYISETSRLPGRPQDNVPVEIVSSARDLGSFVNGARASNLHFSLVVFAPNNLKEANEAISWLEVQPNVLDGQVRPIIVLDAADEGMREIAIRRSDQSQFLTAWGAEMVRVHLHMIEEPELDKRPLRKAILDAAGGIPAETINLVKEMSLSNDPAAVAARWKVTERFPEKILGGPLGRALPLVELADDEDYETLDDLMREQLGCDLMTIGPDLMATGLVAAWNAKNGIIRPSALGIIIAKMVEV
ncbi:MAG: hypothetical protein KI789_05820 [Hoeflea sp.]|nr:hypothetical protein [Hoeflea sp.]